MARRIGRAAIANIPFGNKDASRVARSLMFHPAWYQWKYGVALGSVEQLASHYLTVGAPAGHDPHPLFDTDYYLGKHPDLAKYGSSPLLYYLDNDFTSGCSPSPLFDSDFYLQTNPDVAAAGFNPLVHFILHGAAEGRPPISPSLVPAFSFEKLEQMKGWLRGGSRGDLAEEAKVSEKIARLPVEQRARIIFDENYYRGQGYAGAEDALEHYLEFGAQEALNPSVLFDAKSYVAENKLPSGVNPLLHYLEEGWKTVKRTHKLFDNQFYLNLYDGQLGGLDPLSHYLACGAKAGNFPNPLFDSAWYLTRNTDVAERGVNPLVHYIQNGEAEGRQPNAFFFPLWYLEKYHAQIEGLSPLADYLDHAFSAERQPNEIFNGAWYVNTYPDVGASGTVPLRHFMLHGEGEGRDPGPAFDTRYYVRANPDVVYFKCFPVQHYLESGKAEGRFGRDPYPHWVEQFGTLTSSEKDKMRERIAAFAETPLISILCPVYNTDLHDLRRAAESVRAQIYQNWELCFSDDASTKPGVVEALKDLAASDNRIKICRRSENGHISANTNSAFSLAKGEFIGFLDADDELSEDALFWMVHEINEHDDVQLLFSDEDKIDSSGKRYDAYFKSDWNPALMLSQNAVCHFNVIRKSLLDRVGVLRSKFDGSQDHELVLRCSRSIAEHQIRHIPRILYHWRATETSTALVAGGKPYAWWAGREAILEHLAAFGVEAEVERSETGHYRVLYAHPEDEPLVSILMPSACKLNLVRPCLEKLFECTTYKNFEVIMMVSDIRFAEPEQAAFLNEIKGNPKVRLNIYPDRPFNFSRLNNEAAALARGDYFVFMNDDIEVVTGDWLQQFLARLRLERVGMVGGLLHYPSGQVQHAGVVLGIGGVADHPYRLLPKGDGGYFGRALAEQDVSCVTAACAMTKASIFAEVGGYDEALAVAFNDVDLCVKVRDLGYRIIWTPAVEMVHRESASLGNHASAERKAQFDRESNYIKRKWGRVLEEDPFYNPNLSLVSGRSFQLAASPRM